MNDLEAAICQELFATDLLTAEVGNRIFPGEIPDDQTLAPWVYYSVPESVPFDALDGPNDVRSELEFHILADRYSQAKAIGKIIRSVMRDRFPFRFIKSVQWAGTSEESTEDGYHHSLRFTCVWAEE